MNVRCFVGIGLPEPFREGLHSAGARIRTEAPDWTGEKWVATENLHVTLCFVGEVAADSLPALSHAVGEQVERTAGFTLPIAGLTGRPSLRRCRMLWCRFDDPEGRCAGLAAGMQAACHPFGAMETERLFVPHVTVCRARSPHSLAHEALSRADAELRDAVDAMSVLRVTLFSSRLTPRGPLYGELGTWHLWGA